jgi:3-dehydroquinate dehydratase-2
VKILIINGPNLNLLGKRNPLIYGSESFEGYLASLKEEFKEIEIDYYQSNVEGEIITNLQQADGKYNGVILNAGGYTHTSVAIGDAVEAIETPVIEVHISNIFAREEFRQISYISPHAKGIISGLGLDVYRLAILHIADAVI